jgi:uncharacterized membrane protein
MRRIHLFLVILIVALVALSTLAIVSWYLATSSPAYYGSSWMKQMWSGMGYSGSTSSNGGMGGMMGTSSTATASTSYFWLIPVALGAVVGGAIIGAAFYLAFPELKYIRGTCTPNAVNSAVEASPINTTNPTSNMAKVTLNAPKVSNNCDVLLKTMTPDEKKVIEVLTAHQGKYLQKYVVKEAGLSRLKTHRIIARFAERGIVTVKEFGNTNEIVISDWVKS